MSSGSVSAVEFDVASGHVSAVYFVVLEFITLAVIDIMLIHVVSSLWYRRIINGTALEVKTAEICGVANSLVGRYFAPPNLFAYAVKIVLLGVILWMDINIFSRVVELKDDPYSLVGTFRYDPSSASWGKSFNKAVTRPSADITKCRLSKPMDEEIQFFRVRFNFTGNKVYEDEDANGIYTVNDSTIICMKNGSATFSKENMLERIVGCSKISTSKCQNKTTLEREYQIGSRSAFKDERVEFLIDESRELFNYIITDYTSIASDIWPEYTTSVYSNPTLACLKSTFSIKGDDDLRKWSVHDTCLVTADVLDGTLTGTLMEVWDYNLTEAKFSRRFPGPIVARRLEVSQAYKVVVLRELPNQFQRDSWESFSARLISKGVVYEKSIREVTPVRGVKTVVRIPIVNIAAVGVVLLITAVISFAVISTVAKDTKPRINTINGLSSIAREETEPVGRSLNDGAPVVIGLSKRGVDRAHFGPLRSSDVRVSYRDVKHVD